MMTRCCTEVLGFCFVCFLFGLSSEVLAASVAVNDNQHLKEIDLLMPDVQPTIMDSYLCYAMKIDSTFYITGFQPKAKMETAHHVLLFGCTVPGKTDKVWDCGEMETNAHEFEQGPVCKEGTNIVYAWGMDAPDLHLPEGVGFKVGDETPIQWIVLQVHYKDVSAFIPPNNAKDHSGVTLITTDVRQPKRAGVYLMGTLGEIPPHSTTYMETACSYNEPIELHPFAFRAHAHVHGKVVSGYRVRDGVWTEMGRRSPQLPQMFNNITTPGITIQPGDILAARCTMVNNDNITISVGSTSKDEMCNFYMMYYVDGDQIARQSYCFSLGPPNWNWFLFDGLHPENAPLNASVIPGTTELLKSTQKFIDDMEKSIDQQRQRMEENINELINAIQGYDRVGDIDESPEDPNFMDEVLGQDMARPDEFYQPLINSNDVEEDRY